MSALMLLYRHKQENEQPRRANNANKQEMQIWKNMDKQRLRVMHKIWKV